MHHLVGQGVLDPVSALQDVRAELDAVLGIEAALHPLMGLAAAAADVGFVELAAQLLDAGGQEADDGRVLQQPVALGLAAAAVDGLVA